MPAASHTTYCFLRQSLCHPLCSPAVRSQVKNVYNMALPEDATAYLHRAGRAGRIGSVAGGRRALNGWQPKAHTSAPQPREPAAYLLARQRLSVPSARVACRTLATDSCCMRASNFARGARVRLRAHYGQSDAVML